MNSMKLMVLASVLLTAGAFTSPVSHAAPDSRAFGESWQKQDTSPGDKAQVIYYRDDARDGHEAAMVYIDGQLQSALLPGMFTRFCVAPGSHSIGAYLNDAPGFRGKTDQSFRATLKAGKTYYLRVNTETNGRPQAVSSADAAEALSSLRMQQHALSRASSVMACE